MYKVSTIIPITLCNMHIYFSERTEVWFVTYLFCSRRVWDIARKHIVYKLQVKTTIQEASEPLCFPTDRSVVCDRQKFMQGQVVGYRLRRLCICCKSQ